MIYSVQNTKLGRGTKIEAQSPQEAVEQVCHYKDWRVHECRVVPETPTNKSL